MKTLIEISEENPELYANMAAEATSQNKELFINESGVLDLREYTTFATDYRIKRLSEYPELGDMIDAFCKAEQGDRTELTLLMEKREAIKAKYPKV